MNIVTFIGDGRRLVLSSPAANSERLCLCVCVCVLRSLDPFPGLLSGLARSCLAQGFTSGFARVCPEDRACCDSWCFQCCMCSSSLLGRTVRVHELPFS